MTHQTVLYPIIVIAMSGCIFSGCTLLSQKNERSETTRVQEEEMQKNESAQATPQAVSITSTTSVESDLDVTLKALDEAINQASSDDFASTGLSDKEIGLE